MGWICKCGHNKSYHRYEWDRFRGERDTSCRSEEWWRGRPACRCGVFTDEEKEA